MITCTKNCAKSPTTLDDGVTYAFVMYFSPNMNSSEVIRFLVSKSRIMSYLDDIAE